MENYYVFIIPILAVVLDRYLGDPHALPHPVRWVGKGLDRFESAARNIDVNLKPTGWIAVIIFPLLAWVIARSLATIPYLGVLIALYLAYSGLALGSLMKECSQVAKLVDAGELDEARQALAMLVSRETDDLDEDGIRRTLAETLSENLNDGFVAPLFYLVLFGVGGLWYYKTVSTMDSMWGYKNDKYRELGQGAALLDDILAYIPARITAGIMLLAGKTRGMDYDKARENCVFDARKMESPNAGWPMATAAWLVGAQMGGPATYYGEPKDKPALGPIGVIWTREKIQLLLGLTARTGVLTAVILIPVLGLLEIIL